LACPPLRFADAFFDGSSDFAQVIITGADFRPGVGNADDGFAQIFVGEPDGLEHGARRGPVGPFRDVPAALPTTVFAHLGSVLKSVTVDAAYKTKATSA